VHATEWFLTLTETQQDAIEALHDVTSLLSCDCVSLTYHYL
jgi:hypothetical protein